MMRLFVAVFCGLLWAVQAHAAPAPAEEISKEDAETLKKDLEDAELYKFMLTSKSRLDLLHPYMCGKHIKKARKHREALEALDHRYQGKYDADYQRQFRELKREHLVATTDYERCFTIKIREPRYEKLRPGNIITYARFKQVQEELAAKFKPAGNLDAYIAELKDRLSLYNALNKIEDPNFKPYAKIVFVRGQVRVGHYQEKRFSRMHSVKRGMRLMRNRTRLGAFDAVETGPKGHAKIFVVTGSHRKKLEILLGPNTRIRTLDHLPGKPITGIRLFRGIMRGFSDDWVADIYTRHGGPSGGIRGTEASFFYDPKTDVFQATLAHGDAYVNSGGRKVTLKPATSITVKNGRVGKPRKISKSRWNKLVASTGDGRQDAASAAKWGTGPRSRPRHRQVAGRHDRINQDSAMNRVMRSYARSVTETFLFALRVNDGNALLARTGGKIHADYRGGLKTRSLKSILDKNLNRPRSHKFRCAHCDPLKGTCQVLMDVQQEAQRTGQITPVLFDIRRADRTSELRAFGANLGQGDRLKNFMALKPVCERR